MAQVKHHKFVAALPVELEADAIYYVRAGAGFDLYVTNSSGTVVAYPGNYSPAYSDTTTAVSKTLSNRERCTVTAAGLTVTLPASPQAGWRVSVAVGGFADTLIGRNGSTINGLEDDGVINRAWSAVNLRYDGSTWRLE